MTIFNLDTSDSDKPDQVLEVTGLLFVKIIDIICTTYDSFGRKYKKSKVVLN
jgi:hypothetical protein